METEEQMFADLLAAKQKQNPQKEQPVQEVEEQQVEQVQEQQEQPQEEAVVEQVVEEQAPAKEEEPKQEQKVEEKVEEQAEPFNFIDFYKQHKEDIELATRDLDSVDVDDVDTTASLLIDKMKSEGYSEDEAVTLLEEKYPTQFAEEVDEEDEDIQKELKKEFIKMKSEGRKYLSELKERQSQIKLEAPSVGNVNTSKDSVIEEYVSQQKVAYEKQQQEMVAARTQLSEDLVKDLTTLKFDLGDGNVVEYEPTKEDRELLQTSAKDLPNYFAKNYVKEDGTLDKEGLVKELIAGRRATALMKIALGQGNGQGRGKVIKQDFKNNTMTPNKSSSREREITGDDKIAKMSRALRDGKIDLSQAW